MQGIMLIPDSKSTTPMMKNPRPCFLLCSDWYSSLFFIRFCLVLDWIILGMKKEQLLETTNLESWTLQMKQRAKHSVMSTTSKLPFESVTISNISLHF